MRRVLAVFMLVGTTSALVTILRVPAPVTPPRVELQLPTPTATPAETQTKRPALPKVVWRASTPLGAPTDGGLRRGVKLPARGKHFVTWDPVRKRTPNRWWRRYGTDDLVRVLLRVTRQYGRAYPHAPRVLIGDLSRPHGGDFGRRYGPLGHVSHQNGLDADVYFPRTDRRLRAPRRPSQVDRTRAQDLVNRFVRAGARLVLVGPSLDLDGPRGVVVPYPHHDDHLHLRLEP
jgi:murein endopeptidase